MLKFFMNCSITGVFHGVQFSGTDCSSGVYPMGSRVLTANLLQHRFLSLRGHSFCQEPASVQGSHGAKFPSGASTCSSMMSSRGCRWISALSWTSVRSSLPDHGLTTNCRGELLWCLKHFLPILFHWPWYMQGCFPHGEYKYNNIFKNILNIN